MKEEKDILTGETWIQLSKEEVMYGFLSQCIEALAEAEKCDYVEILERLEKAGMTEGYILAHYEVLHTESMENIVSDVRELLLKRESEEGV